MSVLRVSTPMGYLGETCELLFSRALTLDHALAFLANQQLRFRASQSIPHQRWLLQVYDRAYGHMAYAELDMTGEALDSPRRLEDAEEPYENPVSCKERRIAGPMD